MFDLIVLRLGGHCGENRQGQAPAANDQQCTFLGVSNAIRNLGKLAEDSSADSLMYLKWSKQKFRATGRISKCCRSFFSEFTADIIIHAAIKKLTI